MIKMSEMEAKIFFPFKKNEDIHDLFEERFFQYKLFFVSNFSIKKVFGSKINKMLQMYDAYLTLGGIEEKPETDYVFRKIKFTTNILESFNIYEKNKSEIKNEILKSKSLIVVSLLARQLIDLQIDYNYNWRYVIAYLEEDDIYASNEPDPMDILKSILEFNEHGGYTYKDINELREFAPETLVREAKRLYLCRKIDNKWKMRM